MMNLQTLSSLVNITIIKLNLYLLIIFLGTAKNRGGVLYLFFSIDIDRRLLTFARYELA